MRTFLLDAVSLIAEERKMTLYEVSRKAGFAPNYLYSKLKDKRNWNPHVDTLIKIATVLEVSVADIYVVAKAIKDKVVALPIPRRRSMINQKVEIRHQDILKYLETKGMSLITWKLLPDFKRNALKNCRTTIYTLFQIAEALKVDIAEVTPTM